MAFSYNKYQLENVAVLELNGRVLDEDCLAVINEEADTYISEGIINFIVDLKGTTHLNSSGLNFLIKLLTRCRNKKGDVVICNLPNKVEKLLVVSKLSSVIEAVDSVDSALDKFAQKSL